MRKNILPLLVIVAVMALVPACAGTVYHEKVDLGGGDEADVVGRTGAFGTDLAAVRFKNKAPKVAPILRLQSFESRQVTTQSYDQNCPDPSQLRNINTTTVNERKTSFQDVANPNMPQDQIAVVGGTNPSIGNILFPAAVEGAGMALSGGTTNLIQEGATALAKGGNSRSTSKVGDITNTSKNINDITNKNTNKNKNANKNGNKNGNANDISN